MAIAAFHQFIGVAQPANGNLLTHDDVGDGVDIGLCHRSFNGDLGMADIVGLGTEDLVAILEVVGDVLAAFKNLLLGGAEVELEAGVIDLDRRVCSVPEGLLAELCIFCPTIGRRAITAYRGM